LKKDKLNIFISPLDWGLGHITRTIPVINLFREHGHNVVLGGGRNAMTIYKNEFPGLEFEPLPSCAISYPSKGSLVWSLIKQLPSFFAVIRKEKRKVAKIISKYKIDVIISDNRYGLYNPDVYCVFITHQLMLKLPSSVQFMEKWVYRRHQRMISRFNSCWVPDFPRPPYLAGDLAHLYPPSRNTVFIGPLSRFNTDFCEDVKKEYLNDVIAIISGPEPSRTSFEEKIISQLSLINKKCLIVRGLPNETDSIKALPDNINVVNHLSACDLKESILNSHYIIARAGYSTIMDLVALCRTAVLVPTPGQTEQEYLASYYNARKLFLCISERDMNIEEALNQITLYNWNLNTRTCSIMSAEVQKIEKLLSERN